MKRIIICLLCFILFVLTSCQKQLPCTSCDNPAKECVEMRKNIVRGLECQRLGENEKALAYFKKVNNIIQIPPIHFLMAEVYYDLKKYNIAEMYYDKVLNSISLDDGDRRAIYARSCQQKALILGSRKEYSKAFKYFLEAIDYESNFKIKEKKEKELKILGKKYMADW